MEYCEVVRDLSHKSVDWLFYDEHFRYFRQSEPRRYPWDQIHWELWLWAMSNFWSKTLSFTGGDNANVRVRFRPSTSKFPKGTCWTFHAGKQCRGCQYEHVCFKCRENIRQVNVGFHQPTSAPMSENPEHNLLIQVLDSLPVTPVKADRFENLLAGYSPTMHKTLLVDGFRNGL